MFKTKGNVDKMNRLSGTAFGLIQRAMIADLIRRICAITDPPGNGARQNLVLARAAQLFAAEPGGCPAAIAATIQEVALKTASIREHRNKSIAHLDLLTKQRQGANLPTLVNGDLDTAVDAIFRAMQAIHHAVDGSHVAYEMSMINNAEGEFEWMLNDALRFKRLRELAADNRVTDSEFRALSKHRSSRLDSTIMSDSKGGYTVDDDEGD